MHLNNTWDQMAGGRGHDREARKGSMESVAGDREQTGEARRLTMRADLSDIEKDAG